VVAYSYSCHLSLLLPTTQVSAVLNGFLEHLSRDRALRKRHGSQVCGSVLSQWAMLGAWWGERFSADQRLGAINLLKKLLSVEPKVSV